MRQRFISAMVVLPIAIITILLGGAPLYILATFVASVGIFEIYRAFKVDNKGILYYSIFLVIIYFSILFLNYQQYLRFFYGYLFLSILFIYVFQFPKLTIHTIARIIFGSIYVVYLLTFIFLVRQEPHIGIWMIWFIFAIAVGSDTGAYFIGVRFGKHKLVPQLSPNKTIEGSVGGFIGSAILCLAVSILLWLIGIPLSTAQIILLTVTGAIGSIPSQIGDLVASGIKRETQIKDFGKIMPGHGGVLDRIDSFLVVAPYVYLVMKLWFV